MSQQGATASNTAPETTTSFPWGRSNLPKQLFINNEVGYRYDVEYCSELTGRQYVEAKSHEKLEVRNPKDGSLLADDVALAGEQDVDAAVDAAEAAFPAWKKTSATERRNLLLKLADLIDEHGLIFAELTRLSLGAPLATFGALEIKGAAEAYRYFAGWCDKFAGESYPQEDGFLKIVRNEPLGVTAGIVPVSKVELIVDPS
jgi:aldehyde dehydrogenase (NAD+)